MFKSFDAVCLMLMSYVRRSLILCFLSICTAVVSAQSGREVRYAEALGAGALHFDFALPANLHITESGDYNHDGIIDLLIAFDLNEDNTHVGYALGHELEGGGVGFSMYGPFDVGLYDAIAVGELDGTGVPEIITRRSGWDFIMIHTVDSDSIIESTTEEVDMSDYSAPASTGSIHVAISVRTADLDNDQLSEVILNTRHERLVVRWSSREPEERYQHILIEEFVNTFAAFPPRDFNGDGHLDILLYSDQLDQFLLIPGDGTDSIGDYSILPEQYINLGQTPGVSEFGQFDDHPATDLLYWQSFEDEYVIVPNFTLPNPVAQHFQYDENQILLGMLPDIDGSGVDEVLLIDFVTGTAGGAIYDPVILYDPLTAQARTEVIQAGNADGGIMEDIFDSSPDIWVPRSASIDLNGDSARDILWLGELYDTHSARVSPQRICDHGLPRFGGTRVPGHRAPLHTLPVDLDHDGEIELFQVGSEDAVLVDVENQTVLDTGQFSGAFMSAAADIDGNGQLEIIITNVDGGFAVVQTFPDGSIATEYELLDPAVDGVAIGVVTADFDQDGQEDFAIFPRTTDISAGYIYQGIGGDAVQLIDTLDGVVGTTIKPAVIDFNMDSYPDLAIGNESGNEVLMFVNNTDGTFDYSHSIASASPYWIVSQDMDLDGISDLVVVDRGTTINVHYLAAGGSLDQTISIQEFEHLFIGYIEVVAVNFTGSDLPDIAVANNRNVVGPFNEHLVWEQTMPRVFEPSALLPAPHSAGIAAADMNQDGRVDIITAANVDNSVRIHWSEPVPCEPDLNCDGQLNFLDVSMFLSLYSQQLAPADFNEDGLFNFFDLSAFLSNYVSGCPK